MKTPVFSRSVLLAGVSASLLVSVGAFSGAAFAAAPAASSNDPCIARAVDAAEREYGNDPDGVRTQTVTPGMRYKVTVGIGNPEDGAHLYYVQFPNGCNSTPVAKEAPLVPVHPAQKIVQQAYDRVLWANADTLPRQLEVNPAVLPASAKRLYAQRVRQGATLAAYSLSVAGHVTYGVWQNNLNDSIKAYLFVFDGAGRTIDGAALYHDASVGEKGVSWQNQTVQR